MKTVKTLALALSLSFGFAAAAHAAPRRGQVEVSASAAKAVVVGPVAIAAYSEFSGARFYVVHAVTGTDRDCERGVQASFGSTLTADKVERFSIGAGQIGCVASTGARDIELLWKTQTSAPAETILARR